MPLLSRASNASCVAAAFFLFLGNRIFFCQNYSGLFPTKPQTFFSMKTSCCGDIPENIEMSSSFEFYKKILDSKDVNTSAIAIIVGILILILTTGSYKYIYIYTVYIYFSCFIT